MGAQLIDACRAMLLDWAWCASWQAQAVPWQPVAALPAVLSNTLQLPCSRWPFTQYSHFNPFGLEASDKFPGALCQKVTGSD